MNINNSDITSELKSSTTITNYVNRESGPLEDENPDLRMGSEQFK